MPQKSSQPGRALVSEFRTETGVISYQVLPAEREDAPTLTLLHNFMSTGRAAWGQLLSKFAPHFRVLLPDLPGHGRSLGHPEGFNYHEMARQIAELIRYEGAAEGHLAGCSAGGMIAQLLLYHKLVQPRTLTLVSTTYSTNPATTGANNNLTTENFIAPANWLEATAKMHDPYQGQGYFFGTLLPGFRALRSIYSIDLPLSALRAFDLPVSIIHGDHDEFFPSFIVQAMQKAMSDAELHLVPEATHALLFRKPWVVAELMINFLDQNS